MKSMASRADGHGRGHDGDAQREISGAQRDGGHGRREGWCAQRGGGHGRREGCGVQRDGYEGGCGVGELRLCGTPY